MRELTPLQKRVLAELSWDARLPIEELARRLRVKPHTVRRAFEGLQQFLDLKPVCWTNPFLQDQISFLVFLSVNSPNTNRIKSFTQHLADQSEVHFLASLIGKYQYAMNIFAHGLESLLVTLEGLDSLYGDIIIDKDIVSVTHLVFLTPVLAHSTRGARKQLGFQPTPLRADLDDLDHTIIDLVRRDPLAPVGTIARKCGAPSSTISYRFDQLLKNGTIIGFGYAYDDLKAGYHPCTISLSTRGLSSNLFDTLVEFGRSNPDFSWVARCIGHWDICIGAAVEDLRHLEGLTQKIYGIGGQAIREVLIHSVHEWFKG